MRVLKRSARPEVFVGSSGERLDLADAILANMDDQAVVTVWKRGAFKLSETTMEGLARNVAAADFAIFVLAPDDVVRIRGKSFQSVRDNVLFEVGLFVGALGRRRTLLVIPDNANELRLPSDMSGLTVGRYDVVLSRRNPQAALAKFCAEVRQHIKRLGRIRRSALRSRSGEVVAESLDAEIQLLLGKVARRCREAMNPEPLEHFRFLNAWLKLELHRYFEKRIWPEALDRAQRDVSGVPYRNPAPDVVIDARKKAKMAVGKYGLGLYWDEWAAEHLG